jgi:hypothetical protein
MLSPRTCCLSLFRVTSAPAVCLGDLPAQYLKLCLPLFFPVIDYGHFYLANSFELESNLHSITRCTWRSACLQEGLLVRGQTDLGSQYLAFAYTTPGQPPTVLCGVCVCLCVCVLCSLSGASKCFFMSLQEKSHSIIWVLCLFSRASVFFLVFLSHSWVFIVSSQCFSNLNNSWH